MGLWDDFMAEYTPNTYAWGIIPSSTFAFYVLKFSILTYLSNFLDNGKLFQIKEWNRAFFARKFLVRNTVKLLYISVYCQEIKVAVFQQTRWGKWSRWFHEENMIGLKNWLNSLQLIQTVANCMIMTCIKRNAPRSSTSFIDLTKNLKQAINFCNNWRFSQHTVYRRCDFHKI